MSIVVSCFNFLLILNLFCISGVAFASPFPIASTNKISENESVTAEIQDITECIKEVSRISEEEVRSSDLGLMLSSCLSKKKKYKCKRSGQVVYIDPEEDNDVSVCVGCNNYTDCNDCCDTMFNWLDNTIRNGKCGRECNTAFPERKEIEEAF